MTGVMAAWRELGPAQRRVALAAFLPARLDAAAVVHEDDLTVHAVDVHGARTSRPHDKGALAITTFTFVEAAIFLVAVGVLYLMYARG